MPFVYFAASIPQALGPSVIFQANMGEFCNIYAALSAALYITLIQTRRRRQHV